MAELAKVDGLALAPHAQEMDAGLAPAVEDFKEVRVGTSPLAQAMCLLSAPVSAFTGWWVLEPRVEAISLHFGQLTGYYTKPGCLYTNPCGRELRTISSAQLSASLDPAKITDKRGNTLVVSSILTYRFVDAPKALLNVSRPKWYIETQAQAVLKEVVSQFTYEELKTETEAINAKMLQLLQPRCTIAGARIQSVSLNELVYSQEVASAMLQQQKARALVEARHLLVQGAVEISNSAVETLASNGVNMSSKDKARLVSNLVVVTAGDTDAKPVLTL